MNLRSWPANRLQPESFSPRQSGTEVDRVAHPAPQGRPLGAISCRMAAHFAEVKRAPARAGQKKSALDGIKARPNSSTGVRCLAPGIASRTMGPVGGRVELLIAISRIGCIRRKAGNELWRARFRSGGPTPARAGSVRRREVQATSPSPLCGRRPAVRPRASKAASIWSSRDLWSSRNRRSTCSRCHSSRRASSARDTPRLLQIM